MKKEMKKVPAVRFTGFTGDWEQRKLGDFGSVAMCKRIFKNQTAESGDIPFYKIGTFGGRPDAYISKELFDEYKKKYSYPENGDILISASGSIGRTVEYTGENAYYQDSNIVWLKHDNRIQNSFLKHLYEIIKWAGIEGSTIKRLYNNNILKTEVMVPSVKEQKIIGNYFEKLDNLITLHQRKSDQLKKLKAYFLQNLFPDKGEKVPKIRFKGFTDDWEQRKLEDYLETSTDKNFEGRYSKSDVLSVSGDVGVVNQIEFQGRSFAGASVLNYGVVNTGDIVYTKSPLKSNPYGIIKTNTGKTGIVSTLYAVYHPKQNTDSKFIECYFDSDYRLNKYLHPLVNKGAKNDMKVTADNALKGIVVIPAIKGEQTQIAMFFSKIEELLTLHQRKLEALQTLKKFLLQNLFV